MHEREDHRAAPQAETKPNTRASLVRAERFRSPPKQIRIILPIWGAQYVNLFLNYSLPTLLAPGNVPALAADLPCRFVIMTKEADVHLFRGHPAAARLQTICAVDIRIIDDLITAGNYSTTVTLAYQRAVVELGAAIQDTCFFFLVSDYIVADGSLARVFAHIKDGASGVQAANMQAVDDALKQLFARLRGAVDEREVATPAPATANTLYEPPIPGLCPAEPWPEFPVAVFRPRELVSFALDRLHPATIANMVDFIACHNAHANRLFWRADPQTMIGRFYLMHMICIRPETNDFVISSSCDYSFIPEMCPSGNVDVISDSDDYLVMEFQPIDHERHFLRAGPLMPQKLAASLDEWATAHHRDNARHTIIYHAGEICRDAEILPFIAGTMTKADAFVAETSRFLRPSPVPHRDHPYWRGAIAAHRLHTGQKLTDPDMKMLRGMRAKESRGPLGEGFARLQTWLVGQPLDYRIWQPRWLDFAEVIRRMRLMLAPSKRLLVVSRDSLDLLDWSSQFGGSAQNCDFEFLLTPNEAHRRRNAAAFDVALLIMGEDDLAKADYLSRDLCTMMKPGASVLVVILNRRKRRIGEFTEAVSAGVSRLFNARLRVIAVRFVATSRQRALVQRATEDLARGAVRHPKTNGLFALTLAAPLALISLVANEWERGWASGGAAPRRCSSVFIELRVEADQAETARDSASKNPVKPRAVGATND